MPLAKCSNKIRRIVRIRQMLRRWRLRAASRGHSQPPADVPSGHVAVVVGTARRRYVVRASHLNHPVFTGLLVRAEEEYGFANPGPLTIPCDESLFEEALGLAARSDPARSGRRPLSDELRRCCHFGSSRYPEFLAESRPLLNGI
ncbi:auxin-responsive protein SAUR50-like [Punica granatum]|uniref:Uncharacterized protein n=2 Tax=Punica granatum TaxID=22663 RepID=A0A218X6K1_PUNGR|nr:auxin-responsive protein SAUR50-like [Punica granatum]OWM80339.1 hypothetical protein CDL15_Pgr019619 [Punica granatum]PKI37218.1 hypothetical protein CRG98_042409 [Punica granatum]